MLAFSPLAIANATDNAEKLATPISSFTSVVPIERVQPNYPKSAARNGKEGWVEFSLTVEPDGSVSNLIPVAHSGNRAFITASEKALSQWKYQPATENGEPIQSCMHNVRLDFRMGSNGVRSSFKRFYNKASKVLVSGDIEAIKEIGEKIDNYETKLYDEESYIKLLQLNYAAAIKDQDLYEQRLEDTKLYALKNSMPKSWTVIGERKMDLFIKQHKLADALNVLQQIKHDDNSHLSSDAVSQLTDKIIGYRDSDMHLIVPGEVNEYKLWQHTLTRDKFSVAEINGNLESIDIRCDNKRNVYTVNETTMWKIPSSWKNCQVYISGDKNTTFDLVEYPLVDENKHNDSEETSE
ncbi:energy transducer TonB [Thalassotalea sp. PS06]|uniref:energy transducer TonB n=1 Tax=Thalassotalea sp. PS06 TaxID=2594005 RepID=UPI001161C9FF|nr:energy transducer TonB [Thalassotalea sp. PS06]QDP01212.1 energy transducer TonB [Thalassotalea sp. PS06]